jgi:hypothetical protein
MMDQNLCDDSEINKSIDYEMHNIKNKYFLNENKDIEKEMTPVNQNKKYRKILYLGWHGQGNVGDDLLFDILKKLCFLQKIILPGI